MDLIPISSDPAEDEILDATKDGATDDVRRLLEGTPALIWAQTRDTGDTLLHLALANVDTEVARILLEKGANPEVPNKAGWKPLAVVASNGSMWLEFAGLLLEFGADVDAVNLSLRQSTLHVCAERGFDELASVLLENGASVDMQDLAGETPLFKATRGHKIAMVQLLLQYGASRNTSSIHGLTLERLASANGDVHLLELLRAPPIQRGPRIRRAQPRPQASQAVVALNPAPLQDPEKMAACHAFKATITDFYIGDTEERIERSASIHETLYGKGGEAIMASAREGKIDDKPSFRWYHLPANNIEWVEALVRRHFSERDPRKGQYSEELAADLGIRRTDREHHLISTSKGYFARPFCRKVHLPQASSGHSVGNYTGIFVPYLHYELQGDFKTMDRTVSKAMNRWAARPNPRATNMEGSGYRESNRGSFDDQDDAEPEGAQSGFLSELLIRAYLKPSAGNHIPPLQIRRTLDQYFYSHLTSTSRRDGDQVIQRYTAQFADAATKMFMVDQLWLWILDDDTVISCSALRWDCWKINPGDAARAPSWDDFAIKENDPLNIHQNITSFLKQVRREAITKAEDLCRVIALACLNSFDPYATPSEYHFFDFVEHSIGQVMDQISECFREFRVFLDLAAAADEVLPATDIKIELETRLLGEIEDIRDELSILRLVLEDQKTVTEELEDLFRPADLDLNPVDDLPSNNFSLKGSRVLVNHLGQISRMEALATRTVQTVRSLLKLKQQHASLSEAHSARKQAEYTSRQAQTATSYNKKVADQLTLARQQAEETAKQGNVILLFTVVTVIFLPLSFMTSFFTIELDAFPFNAEGKMPIGTILAIILSVSAGVSIPFILLAFNYEAVVKWTSAAISAIRTRILKLRRLTALMLIIIIVVAIALSVVLSQPLDGGIKAGVGIGLALVASMALFPMCVPFFRRKKPVARANDDAESTRNS